MAKTPGGSGGQQAAGPVDVMSAQMSSETGRKSESFKTKQKGKFFGLFSRFGFEKQEWWLQPASSQTIWQRNFTRKWELFSCGINDFCVFLMTNCVYARPVFVNHGLLSRAKLNSCRAHSLSTSSYSFQSTLFPPVSCRRMTSSAGAHSRKEAVWSRFSLLSPSWFRVLQSWMFSVLLKGRAQLRLCGTTGESRVREARTSERSRNIQTLDIHQTLEIREDVVILV